MRRVFLFIPMLLAIILGVTLYAGIGKDSTALESELIGDPVPMFELASLEDADVTLGPELFRGHVSLMNVWGTWCPACRDEHGDLVWLAREKGVRIVGLNYKDTRAKAIEWLDTLGDPYSVNIYDPEGRLGYDMGVYGAPETFVIDKEGIVRYRHVGVVDEKVWETTLEPLVREYGGEG
ncbi:MAG: DsbE family thiol:disulfide interchange protein [Oleiphilaceae bacterium]|nr:DsbE family thiol:disulfide interchange protein [Oleiphilaceae bacterium]